MLLLSTASGAPAQLLQGRVVGVTDGDTVAVGIAHIAVGLESQEGASRCIAKMRRCPS
jgi:hypothetical protein